MKRGRNLWIPVILLAAVLAAGCGSRKSAMAVTETAAAAAYDGYDMEMAEEAAMDIEAPEAKMAGRAAGNSMAGDFMAQEGGISAEQMKPGDISPDRKLIRNVSLSYQTDDFEGFTAMLQNETKKLGGYIESSDMSKNAYNSTRSAYFELRIPKDKLDSFLGSLEGTANLLHRGENTQDVTLQYHDIESRKKALETEYDTLLRLLEQADSMDAILALNQRLSEIRYELDSYESNLRMYDNQVDYSRVSVSVEETKVYTPAAESSAWDKIRLGFKQNLEDVGEMLVDIGIFLLSSIPMFIVFGLFIAAVVFVIRRIVRRIRGGKKKDRKQNKQEMQEAAPVQDTEETPAGKD